MVNKANIWAKCPRSTSSKGSGAGLGGQDLERRRRLLPGGTAGLYGPGTDSGTFDYFTEAVVGEEGASRSDYTQPRTTTSSSRASPARRAASATSASYYLENRNRLNAVEIDGGDGCVEPSNETVQDGSYTPLSRPLFVYVNEDKLAENDVIEPFPTYILDNEPSLARGAKYVPMQPEHIERERTVLESGGVGTRLSPHRMTFTRSRQSFTSPPPILRRAFLRIATGPKTGKCERGGNEAPTSSSSEAASR